MRVLPIAVDVRTVFVQVIGRPLVVCFDIREVCNALYPDIITTLIVTLNTPHNYDHVRFVILRVPTPDHGNTRTDDVINMLGTDHYL